MAAPVHLLFFAAAREAVGRPRLERAVDAEGIALERLLDELVQEYPRFGRVLHASRVVVNGAYLKARDVRVRPGDEVAIHPPYSGG